MYISPKLIKFVSYNKWWIKLHGIICLQLPTLQSQNTDFVIDMTVIC